MVRERVNTVLRSGSPAPSELLRARVRRRAALDHTIAAYARAARRVAVSRLLTPHPSRVPSNAVLVHFVFE